MRSPGSGAAARCSDNEYTVVRFRCCVWHGVQAQAFGAAARTCAIDPCAQRFTTLDRGFEILVHGGQTNAREEIAGRGVSLRIAEALFEGLIGDFETALSI